MQTCANSEFQHGGNGEFVPFVVPNTLQCPMIEDVSINVHHWETNYIKSNYFHYCEMYTAF